MAPFEMKESECLGAVLLGPVLINPIHAGLPGERTSQEGVGEHGLEGASFSAVSHKFMLLPSDLYCQ